MENHIKKITNQQNATYEDLISCLEIVKQNGDVAVIKLDGERREKQYTVFITFPSSKNKVMIRADESSLKDALLKVLIEYVK